MIDNDDDMTPGLLSDGTELADVTPDMPLEVRDSGGLDWRLAYVVQVLKDPIFPEIMVEMAGNGSIGTYLPRYARRYRSK